MSPLDPDPDALAAELALGLLDGPERAAGERRMLVDPAFAREVEAWRARLAALADQAPAASVPDDLWTRIERQLGENRQGGGGQGATVLSLQRGVRLWRSVSAAAGAVAAALAVALLIPRTPPPSRAPMMTARLSPTPKGPAMFVALYDPARRAIVLTPAAIQAVAGRSPELWLIPAGGKPVPLGVATFGGSVQMISTRGAAPMGAGMLAVSIEPQGGSPTGQPTGPVVATGQLTKL